MEMKLHRSHLEIIFSLHWKSFSRFRLCSRLTSPKEKKQSEEKKKRNNFTRIKWRNAVASVEKIRRGKKINREKKKRSDCHSNARKLTPDQRQCREREPHVNRAAIPLFESYHFKKQKRKKNVIMKLISSTAEVRRRTRWTTDTPSQRRRESDAEGIDKMKWSCEASCCE